MSNKPTIKPVSGARGDKLLDGYVLEICLRGTDQPYCRIKPGYEPGIGPHIMIYRVLATSGPAADEELVLVFGAGAVHSLLRWLPLIFNHARRLESRPRRLKGRHSQQG